MMKLMIKLVDGDSGCVKLVDADDRRYSCECGCSLWMRMQMRMIQLCMRMTQLCMRMIGDTFADADSG